ncbi:PREDICTED: rho-associated protein kinase 2-like [Priapulus caudatus]|uniref:non-specific serine/threonine protein kinase n=1 Tax=Priapulus caudatus TaxID=37621 RepID=A0ABM1EA42_PRICU|nr:PREDICTED: rho-associated protein kinase 2-like [Priapulus caudatus]
MEAELQSTRQAREEIEQKYKVTIQHLEKLTREEVEIRKESRELERNNALIKHELKEAQRKTDAEVEARKRAEQRHEATIGQLQDEVSKNRVGDSHSRQVNEKLNQLEKQVLELTEQLNCSKESESKIKKTNHELTRNYLGMEQQYKELKEKYDGLLDVKQSLEKDVMSLQMLVEQERNNRSQESTNSVELESKISNYQHTIERLKAKEQETLTNQAKNREQIVRLEKAKAMLELEVRTLQHKLDEEQHLHHESVIRTEKLHMKMSREEANSAAIDDVNQKLHEERDARQKSEQQAQEADRHRSMLSVDYNQLQQQHQRIEQEFHAEIEKTKSLSLSLEQESQKRALLHNDLKQQSHQVTMFKNKEKQLTKEVHDLREQSHMLREELQRAKTSKTVDDLQMKELQDQLEAEQYFSTLYKNQLREVEGEMAEKASMCDGIESDYRAVLSDRDKLRNQLQLALTKADSEELARKIAEEHVSDLEKEKTMMELEIKDLIARQKTEISNKETQISTLQDKNKEYGKTLERVIQEKDETDNVLKKAIDDLNNRGLESNDNDEQMEKMRKKLEANNLLKQQAVNKLEEILKRKDFSQKNTKKANAADLRKKEKECRKLQQDLTQEKEKFSNTVMSFRKQIQDVEVSLYEEGQMRTKQQMESDSKDLEIEQLKRQLALIRTDVTSINSGSSEDDIVENPLEGWLAIPNKQNLRKHGWKRQYVIVSSRKLFFYNSNEDRQNSDPVLILDLHKMFHVRAVSQGDVIRAEVKDIPKIFQILYASEGEAVKPVENAPPEITNPKDPSAVAHKGHDFVPVFFHMPTPCEACSKPLWHMFKPPPALECSRCHVKIHKDHMDRKQEVVAPCRVNYENRAKELLLMASTVEEQQRWVMKLSKTVFQKGIIISQKEADRESQRGGSPRSSLIGTLPSKRK